MSDQPLDGLPAESQCEAERETPRIDDGGPAWPTRGERHPNALRDEWIVRPSEGMSVRMLVAKDFYAAILSSDGYRGATKGPQARATEALQHADALLAEYKRE